MKTRIYRFVALVTFVLLLLSPTLTSSAEDIDWSEASEIVYEDLEAELFPKGMIDDSVIVKNPDDFFLGDSLLDPREGVITPDWTNTNACSINLYVESNGTYMMTATCTAKSASYSITIKLELQKLSGSWSTTRTVNGSGKGITDASGSGTLSSGVYRAKATFNVNGETITVYSQEKTVK